MEPKTYLVTGASKGIGLELSLSLATSGINVILLARDTPILEQSRDLVQSISPLASTIVCDLADNQSIDAAIVELNKKLVLIKKWLDLIIKIYFQQWLTLVMIILL